MLTLSQKFKAGILVFLGSLTWSLTMVKSGLVYSYGMGFWGPNGHDGVWHVSLINSLSHGSLDMPIFSGYLIQNYHVGFDLILALVHKLTSIPASTLYFQILPPLLAIGIGWSVFSFVYAWRKNFTAAWISTFFVYFGGSLGWMFNGGESAFWSQQSISTLVNPPFALSLIIIFIAMKLMISSPQKIIVISLLFASLSLIKVYASILVLAGLLLISIVDRRNFKLFLITLFISLALFIPLNYKSSSLIVFKPGWFLQTLVSLSDRFYLPRLYQALISPNPIKKIMGYSITLFIFIVGNFGTRLFIIGRQKLDKIYIFILTIIFSGLVVPMLFVQTGTPWNTIQFFYYSVMLLGVLTGLSLSKLRWYLVIPILLLTLPTTYVTLGQYLPSRPPAKISLEELEALKFLSTQPTGITLTYPAMPDAYAPPPRPLYLYESTAYVSAYSGHLVFMEDEVNLNITNYPWPARKQQIKDFYNYTSLSQARQFISDNHIRYIYLPQVASIRPKFSATELGGKVLFENPRVAIWMVQ